MWFFTAAQAAGDTLTEAEALRQSGDYLGAIATLEGFITSEDSLDSEPANLALAELLMVVGRLEEASSVLGLLLQQPEPLRRAQFLFASLQAERGQYEDAIISLDALLRVAPHLEGQLLRGSLWVELGNKDAAASDLLTVAELASGSSPTVLEAAWAGRALHLLERFSEAHQTFATAVETDRDVVEARLWWADLLLEKYRPDQADELALEVLARNPSHPDGLVMRARANVLLDPATASELALRALEINPSHRGGMGVLALLAVLDEDFNDAMAWLERVLTINPHDTEALALLATISFLRGDEAGFERLAERALAVNASNAQFFTAAADLAGMLLRVTDAVALYERALEVDPNFWRAFSGLGIALSRQGHDVVAVEFLERAVENDPFDARALRMLNWYRVALPEYETVTSEHFSFLMHHTEREVLEAYVPDLVEATYATYASFYTVEPDIPISIELFADTAAFAIRSAGLPHIGPHGVCFGRVITSHSPSRSDFNWAEVLAHELSHAFTLALSDARVPRWLAEGMAEYDAHRLDPAWGQTPGLSTLALVRHDELVSVADLNRHFVRPDSDIERGYAYWQSTQTVEFIAQTWGTDALLTLLMQFRDQASLDEALEHVTGNTVTAFDDAFARYMRRELASLLEGFEPSPGHERSPIELELLVESAPEDAALAAELAMARFQQQRIDDCQALIARALDLDPNEPMANFLSALFSLRSRSYSEARAQLEVIINQGFDGYTLRNQLGFLARREGRVGDAMRHYQRATEIYPEGVEPYSELADIHIRSGDLDDAVDILYGLLGVTPADLSSAQRLIRLLMAAGRAEEAWPACQHANFVAPFDAGHHFLCAQVAESRDDREGALRELTVEMLVNPDPTPEAIELLERLR